MQRSFFVRLGLTAALVVLSARPSAAQETLDAARDLYASAAYEDALAVLDRLSTTTGSPSDRFVINQYRAFCYLALGRAHDAQRAIETLVSDRPLYQPSDAEASPRLRSAFSVVRQRMLPAIVQQKYAQAKTAFDYKDYVAAEAGFTEVINALGDPDMGTAASLPPLSDMGTLASGFKELSVREIARGRRSRRHDRRCRSRYGRRSSTRAGRQGTGNSRRRSDHLTARLHHGGRKGVSAGDHPAGSSVLPSKLRPDEGGRARHLD